MKVLIIDNGTHYKKRLNDLLESHELKVVPLAEISLELHQQNFDLIVLSGSYGGRSVLRSAETILKQEQEFILNATVPVIGLCYAAQLIAYMYGAKLSRIPDGQKIKGLKLIQNVKKTPFDFFGAGGAKVWASQRWRITDLPEDLDLWCSSPEGAEVFKHKTKPIYGLQFHPEHQTENDDGRKIFEKIIEIEVGKSCGEIARITDEILTQI